MFSRHIPITKGISGSFVKRIKRLTARGLQSQGSPKRATFPKTPNELLKAILASRQSVFRTGGDKDREAGSAVASASDATSNLDRSVVFVHDLLNHPQSETSTGLRLGGEERLKQVSPDGYGNARAGVGNRDPDAV